MSDEVDVSPTGCPVSERAAAFDAFEGPFQVDPAEALRWARDQEPVFYSPKLGYWVVTRYDDVKTVFRDNILFSPSNVLEKFTPAPPEAVDVLNRCGYAMGRTLVNEDEPVHMDRRRLLLDSFAPSALDKHQAAVRHLARQYMDRFIDKGRADLVSEMFREIPQIVALHFLGVEDEDRKQLLKFSGAHTLNTWGRPTPAQQMEVAESVGKFWQASSAIIDKMRQNPSGDGWMQYTIRQHEKHPDIVTESYLYSMMMAILVAAHETTSNAAANAFRHLLTHRNIWAEICEQPKLIPNAIEECLRYAGSIVSWRRRATADTKIGDVAIPKGANILVATASANHDVRHFENPGELDLYRDNTTDHLTFGYGSHQCLGKNIARMELRIFLEEFIRRLPHMELIPDQEFTYPPNSAFRGPANLWVRWDAEKNPERLDPSILDKHQSFRIGAPTKGEIARRLKVTEVHNEADGVVRLVIEHSQGRNLPSWSPGSHIEVTAGGFNRKYSLCGYEQHVGKFEVAILKEQQSRGGSVYFHDNITPGSEVNVVGPKNHFRLEENATDYLLIAGGIGITPILAMADKLRALGKPYEIHYAGRSLSSMAFIDRLRRNHGDRLTLYPKDEGKRMNLATITADITGGKQVYACGPERLLNALDVLSNDWPISSFRFEHFNPVETKLDPTKEHAFDVELQDSDIKLRVNADQSVLDAMLAAGIDVGCDCEEGICGTCEVDVLGGEIDHRDRVLSQSEKDAGNRMMVCVSRAKRGNLKLAR